MLCLPSRPGRVLRLLFFRDHGTYFSDRDRDVLAILRPHIYEAVKVQAEHRRPRPELTKRQRETLRLVAEGYTNRQIARRLSITEGTVRKHLENAFVRLNVTSRTEAVLRVFGDTPP
jgi:DNA-binding NarL/FixJ family response regulator